MIALFACEAPKKSNTEEVVSEATEEKVEPTTTDVKTPQPKSEAKASYKMINLSDEAGDCQSSSGSCAEVSVSYPAYVGKNEKFINKQIEKKVAEILGDFVPDNDQKAKSPKGAMDIILEDFIEFTSEYDDMSERWKINLSISISHIRGNILSVEVENSSYTGGAHDSRTTTYFNYDFKKKKEVDIIDLISNQKEFISIVEKQFRKDKGYTAADNLSDMGYFFENGEFEITGNVGLSQKGIVVHYNSYEIAAYAMGSTTVVVPYNDVSSLLAF